MLNTHFCTCTNHQCRLHPCNQDNGCDGCIKANLESGDIPKCFFVAVSETGAKEVTDFSYNSFACFVKKYNKQREQGQ